MTAAYSMLDCLIPITQFNRGQASKIFDRLKDQKQLIVLKNNQASAVILSPEEFERLSEIEENYNLLVEAKHRMAAYAGELGVSRDDALKQLGVTEADIENAEEPVIEGSVTTTGGQTMTSVSESVMDTVLHLPADQIPAFTAFLSTLKSAETSKKDAGKRIGIAKNIVFPSDFDDIDYGTSELFGLNV